MATHFPRLALKELPSFAEPGAVKSLSDQDLKIASTYTAGEMTPEGTFGYNVREAAFDELNGRSLHLPNGGEWFESLTLSRRPYAIVDLDLSHREFPARSRQVEFLVVVMIGKDGRVVDVQSFGEDLEYEMPVVDELSKVLFSPGEINGAAVNSMLLLSFSFDARAN
ncbi:hypothetical protein [Niveibacterium sp.]|uniref:hypothetical protein n=1 Tax=Niveibacterium sp. TaxID=2017444 RepID=UPI0035B0D5E9